MNEDVLEQIYQERLEERIISYIAETMEISLEEAMKAYYSSRLANKIHNGRYGVQYLDYKVLVQILYETEPELFEKKESDMKDGSRSCLYITKAEY